MFVNRERARYREFEDRDCVSVERDRRECV